MTKAVQPIFHVKGIHAQVPEIKSWEINQVICDEINFFEENPQLKEIESLDSQNVAHAIDLLHADKGLNLSVNARMELFTSNSAQRLHELLHRNKSVLDRLTIEIVEHGFCHSGNIGRKKISEVEDNLAQVSSMGLNLSIDDYGSGHNTAGLLLWNVWSEVKIDGQIILAAENGSARANKVLNGVTEMLKDLGLSVIYEHIESQRALDIAVENEANGVQGFFIGRPQIMSIDEMLKGLFQLAFKGDREMSCNPI